MLSDKNAEMFAACPGDAFAYEMADGYEPDRVALVVEDRSVDLSGGEYIVRTDAKLLEDGGIAAIPLTRTVASDDSRGATGDFTVHCYVIDVRRVA